MIEESPIFNINYFTEIKLNRMLVPNNDDDEIFLFIHSTIHNFTFVNEEMLIVNHEQFQTILEMLPKEDAKVVNELLSNLLTSTEPYLEYQFNEFDDIFGRFTKFYFVVHCVNNTGNEALLDLLNYKFEYPPYKLRKLIKKDRYWNITINKPIDSFTSKISHFAEIYNVYLQLKKSGFTDDEATQICGITNPVIFELLNSLHEASETEFNDDRDREKIYKAYQNMKYTIGALFTEKDFCNEYDITEFDLKDILNERKGKQIGIENRLII
ncbi:MAG: hypothetical protein ACEQSR_10335 [Candidatus Methylacidiphilales bacterium]